MKLSLLNIVKIFLGFLGILAVVLIIYAGFLWMTAGGEEEKVKEINDIIEEKQTELGNDVYEDNSQENKETALSPHVSRIIASYVKQKLKVSYQS